MCFQRERNGFVIKNVAISDIYKTMYHFFGMFEYLPDGLVLSHFDSTCLVSSRLVSFCLVSSSLVSSCRVLSCLFCLILYCLFLSPPLVFS